MDALKTEFRVARDTHRGPYRFLRMAHTVIGLSRDMQTPENLAVIKLVNRAYEGAFIELSEEEQDRLTSLFYNDAFWGLLV